MGSREAAIRSGGQLTSADTRLCGSPRTQEYVTLVRRQVDKHPTRAVKNDRENTRIGCHEQWRSLSDDALDSRDRLLALQELDEVRHIEEDDAGAGHVHSVTGCRPCQFRLGRSTIEYLIRQRKALKPSLQPIFLPSA